MATTGPAMNTPSVIPTAILLPIARCSGDAFAIRSCDLGSIRDLVVYHLLHPDLLHNGAEQDV